MRCRTQEAPTLTEEGSKPSLHDSDGVGLDKNPYKLGKKHRKLWKGRVQENKGTGYLLGQILWHKVVTRVAKLMGHWEKNQEKYIEEIT